MCPGTKHVAGSLRASARLSQRILSLVMAGRVFSQQRQLAPAPSRTAQHPSLGPHLLQLLARWCQQMCPRSLNWQHCYCHGLGRSGTLPSASPTKVLLLAGIVNWLCCELWEETGIWLNWRDSKSFVWLDKYGYVLFHGLEEGMKVWMYTNLQHNDSIDVHSDHAWVTLEEYRVTPWHRNDHVRVLERIETSAYIQWM